MTLPHASPGFLPLLRVVLCGFLAFERLPKMGDVLRAMAKRPPVMDAPLIDVLGLPWPPPAWVPGVYDVALPVLAVLACVGLFTRPALLLLGVLWLYAGAVQAGWGFFNHTPALPMQLVLVLALVPGSTAYGVERWVRARVRREPVIWSEPVPRWGERLALVLMGAFYLTAGISKLRYGAGSWLDGSSLAFYLGGGATRSFWYGPLVPDPALLWKDGFQIDGYLYLSVSRDVTKAIAAQPWLCAVLSWCALVIELSAIGLLLAGARVRGAGILVLQAFHVGMNVLIGPAFYPWQVALLCAFPFAESWAWWRARRANAAAVSETARPPG